MFFGLFGDDWDMVLDGFRIKYIFDIETGKVNFSLVLFLWKELDIFVDGIFEGIQVFVKVIQIDVTFDFIDHDGDSSQGFVKVVIVPNITDWVQ